MEINLFFLIIIYLLGILISYYSISFKIIIFILIIVLIYLFYTKKQKKLNKIILIIIILLVGSYRYSIVSSSKLHFISKKNVKIEGLLTKEEKNDKFILEIKKINNKKISKEKILITIYNNENNIKVNTYIRCNLILKSPSRNTNPKLFNYRDYLKGKKIFYTTSIKSKDVEILELDYNKIIYYKENIKSKINDKLKQSLSEDSYKLLFSILLSDNILNDRTRKDYTNLGISHVLAASGLHINLIVFFLEKILSIFNIKKQYKYGVILMFLWIYAFIIDFPASIVRASIMFSVKCIKEILNLPYRGKIEALFTIFIMLIYNPVYIYNLSFKLSAMATLGIKFFEEYLINRFYHIDSLFLSEIIPTLSVVIFLFPIEMYYFNTTKPISIISNILIIPIISLSLLFSICIIFTPINFVSIINILSYIVDKIIYFNMMIIKLLNKVNIFNITLFSPDTIFIFYYYILLLVLLLGLDNPKLKRALYYYNFKFTCYIKGLYQNFIIYILVLAIATNYICILTDDKVTIDFVDVSQGDCALIRYKEKNILIDTGGTVFGDFKIGQNITLPYLVKNNIKKIDLLFITHFDKDHYEALYDIIPFIKIDKIYCSYRPEKDLYLYLLENNIKIELIDDSSSFIISNKLYLDIVYPNKKTSEKTSSNDKSLVILLKYYNKKLLFTGDIEELAEEKLISNNKINNIDILKVAHHGSKTSSKLDFIKKTNPDYAIISVGRNNRFNHPDEEVINRFKNNGTKIYRTDKNGRIRLELSSRTFNFSLYSNECNKYNKKYIFLRKMGLYFLYFILFYYLFKDSIYSINEQE